MKTIKTTTKMLILMSLMVILCSLTAINASNITDTANDNTLTDSNNENDYQEVVSTYGASDSSALQSSDNNDNSKSLKTEPQTGSFDELKKIINNADEKSTIYLDKDYKNFRGKVFSNLEITIRKQITIDGQGHTLDGNKEHRIFNIKADNVVLRNMTIINSRTGYGDNGGLIYWSGKNGVIKNCVLKQSYLPNNDVTCNGGGIYASGEHLTIKNCEFNALRGRYGSALYLKSKNNVIDNCSFTYNYYYNEPFYTNNDYLQQNKKPAKYDNTLGGGAIYIDKTGNSIKNSYFAYNLAKEGGAIYLNGDKNEITSCIFYNNRASKYGGAIYVNSILNKINNNIFYLNNLKDNIWGRGECSDIFSADDMYADKNWWGNVNRAVCTPKDSKLMKDKNVQPTTNNEKVVARIWYYLDVVDKSGKTIPNAIALGDYPEDNFDFKIMFKLSKRNGYFNYPNFANEFNLTGDKLSLYNGSTYTDKIIKKFNGNSLSFNMHPKELKSTLTMENDMFSIKVPFTFKKDSLSKLQNIIDNVWENDTVTLYNDYTYDPSVDKKIADGIEVNKTITIDGRGATIDLDHKSRGFFVTAPEVVIKNIKIINGNLGNGGMGGAIYFGSKFGEIINATFEENTADYGGAVAVNEKYVTVTNSTFKNNYATEKGAGIYLTAPGLKITNNLFESNKAAGGENPCVEGYSTYISYSDNNTYINNSITEIGGKDDNNTPSYKSSKIKQFTRINSKNYKQVSHDKIIITSNNKEISLTNNLLTLNILNQIFNKNFINGHLLVYIDGKLVFNSTTTDDLSQIICSIADLLSGNHEIRVEFTDKDGNTNSFTENIKV